MTTEVARLLKLVDARSYRQHCTVRCWGNKTPLVHRRTHHISHMILYASGFLSTFNHEAGEQ